MPSAAARQARTQAHQVKRAPADDNRAVLRDYVARIREDVGLTREGLARKLDVSTKTVRRLERGDLVPDLFLLLRLISIAPDDWKLRLAPFLAGEATRWGESCRRQAATQGGD